MFIFAKEPLRLGRVIQDSSLVKRAVNKGKKTFEKVFINAFENVYIAPANVGDSLTFIYTTGIAASWYSLGKGTILAVNYDTDNIEKKCMYFGAKYILRKPVINYLIGDGDVIAVVTLYSTRGLFIPVLTRSYTVSDLRLAYQLGTHPVLTKEVIEKHHSLHCPAIVTYDPIHFKENDSALLEHLTSISERYIKESK